MPSVRHDEDSELIHAQFLRVEDVTFFDRTQPPAITPDKTDLLHVVREGDILDNMAKAAYGNERLKWVIQWVNDIRLEPVDLIPGEEIRIPTRERLRKLGLVR